VAVERPVLVRDCDWVWGGGASVSNDSEFTGAEVPDSFSKIDGSEGGGPSSAHLRDSYLERMNDSILLKH
jgi:hypothetical protein